jgi:hypothetical protein
MAFVRFQVLMTMIFKTVLFRDAVLCNLVVTNQHFREAYCLYHQGEPHDEKQAPLKHKLIFTRLHSAEF